MTTQLKLLDPQNTPQRPAASNSFKHLDQHTREVGLIGARNARAALAEARRRAAERDAARLASRDNELAERGRSARRARLTLAATPGDQSTESTDKGPDSPTSPTSGTPGHRSAA